MQRNGMATGWKRLSYPVSPVRMRQCPLYCRTAGCDSGAVSRSNYSILSGAESAAGAGNRIDERPSGGQFLHEWPLRERQDTPVLRAVPRIGGCWQDSLTFAPPESF